jgi:phosphate transport system substrate-binding protein
VRCFLIALAILAGVSLASEATAQEQPFRIAGSGTNIPLTRKILDAYGERTGIRAAIPASIGSAGAIKALQAGKIDVGLLSRPLKQEELGAGLVGLAYARVGVVLGANRSVPDRDLDAPSLVSIFAGRKSTWTNGRMIIVLSRESGDSSNAVLMAAVPGFREVLEASFSTKRWDVLYTDADEAEAIASTRDSLGLTDTTVLVDRGGEIKPLRFGGAEPTIEELKRGSYPLTKDLWLVFREPLPAAAKAFVDFALSDAAAPILESGGAIRPPGSR